MVQCSANWPLAHWSYSVYISACLLCPINMPWCARIGPEQYQRKKNPSSTCKVPAPIWIILLILYPSAPRTGWVLSSRFGRVGARAGGCQTCGTHISVIAWRIFSVRSCMELSRPVVVHGHGHLPIRPIWACPRAKNLFNLPQIGSRLCGTRFSETARWIYPI